MPTFNGILDTVRRTITHKGDYDWDTAPTWDNYTSWVQYTGDGTPLLYQTDIIDLGEVKTVTPEISFSADGTVRPMIEYSETSSDLSDEMATTTQGKYTDDNTATGTPQTYTILDYYDNDYMDVDPTLNQNYEPFTARYVKFSAFVENFGFGVIRKVPVLRRFNWRLKQEQVSETVNNLSVSGESTAIPLNNVRVATNIQAMVHDQANKKLVAMTSKGLLGLAPTIRVVDANTFDTAGVSATVDLVVYGYPSNIYIRPRGLVSETP